MLMVPSAYQFRQPGLSCCWFLVASCSYPKNQRAANITTNQKPTTSNQLHTHIKISQCIIQTRFQIGAWFALADDEGTAHVIFTGRKFFQITSRYHYTS